MPGAGQGRAGHGEASERRAAKSDTSARVQHEMRCDWEEALASFLNCYLDNGPQASPNHRPRLQCPHKRPSASPGSSLRISARSQQVLPSPPALVHAKQPSLFIPFLQIPFLVLNSQVPLRTGHSEQLIQAHPPTPHPHKHQTPLGFFGTTIT